MQLFNEECIKILVHKSITSTELPEFVTDCELTWAKVKLQNHKDLFIGAFYMAERRKYDLDQLQSSLNKLTANGKKNCEVILAGDFNCPDIDWNTNTAHSTGDDRATQQLLVDITSSELLSQVHNSPTRGPNTLDLVFTTNPSLVKSSVSIPGISDHDAVVTDLTTKPQVNHQKPRLCRKFGKADWEKMRTDMEEAAHTLEDQDKEGADVNTLWSTFKSLLNKSIDQHIPSFKLKSKNSLPWLTPQLKKLLKRKQRLYKKARSSNDWSPFRKYQKYCRQQMRRAEWQYINGKIQEGLDRNDSKPFWRYIKARKQDSSGVAPLKENGKLFSDSESKARILLNQFKSVFTKQSTTTLPNLKPPPGIIEPIKISPPGICKLLKNLQTNKASGPDNIPNIVLKNLATEIAPSLSIIFQKSLDSSKLPEDWLSANVTCAFKKGDRHSASNYRPISLTSVPCKLLEHIICKHMLSHLEKFKLLTNLNHGFRSGYSTETQLLTTTEDLFKSYDQGKQTDMAILDFSKAFDTVPHDRLLHKLSSYGIGDPLLSWLRCFLTQRSMRVVVDGIESPSTSVDSGVPQGTVLGPILFLCHINDLPETVKSQVRLFADDCLLYREINNFSDHHTLQEDLAQLELWAHTWGMRFNATKCYIMSLARNPKSSFFYSLDNTILQSVTSNPYLGVQFSQDLSWSHHINGITKKANSTLGFLRRNLRNCPQTSRRTAYLALVRPLLEYGAIIWDPHLKQDITKLERTQRAAVRFIARDYRSTTPGFITGLLKKHDLPLLQERREHTRLIFFYKVVEGLVPAIPPDSFLTKPKPGRLIRPKLSSKDFTINNPVQSYIRNNDRPFVIPKCSTAQYKNSYFPKTIEAWNKLPNSTVHAKSVENFKSALAVASRR